MANGELKIKNDRLSAILDSLLAEEAGRPVFEGKSEQAQGEELLATYALDMIRSARAAGVELDLTYATLPELPAAVAACYRRYLESDTRAVAVGGTKKAIAAYFIALAMNEHGCAPKVERVPDPAAAAPDTVWGVFRILTGDKKKTDLLLPVNTGCWLGGPAEKRVLTFDLTPLFQEYRAATGIDLMLNGIRVIAFDA